MVCGGLMSWFVVVQYLPDNLKIGVVSLKSQLQLMWWFMVVRGGSWWFNIIMPPSVKFN